MADRNQVAVITGGGTGIGRAAALALAAAGWQVVVAGRREQPLVEVAEQIGGDGLAVVADVTVEADVTRLFSTAVAGFGRVDLLFNNAGTSAPPVPFEDLTVEQWSTVVDTNLTASFLCAREAFRTMAAQNPSGGRIINNGSISAHAPRPSSAPYTSTKHGVSGLTKALSLDGRRLGIACGQIDIGNAATSMAERMAVGVPQADGSTRPEPLMDVDDVGRAVAYMAGLPLDTNVLFMTVMANAMPFVGRG
jgi:NAD(P)-dependent dehydrogenase (short-subunit alcohol dehydrogenase family)